MKRRAFLKTVGAVVSSVLVPWKKKEATAYPLEITDECSVITLGSFDNPELTTQLMEGTVETYSTIQWFRYDKDGVCTEITEIIKTRGEAIEKTILEQP